MKVLIATYNEGKLHELRDCLQDLPLELFSQDEFNIPQSPETGLSFLENAIQKARNGAKYAEMPCIADDSGLCVDALGGKPGIFSSRFAAEKASSEENMAKLLDSIQSIKGEDRSAKFFCALAFVRHEQDPMPIICQAAWEGQILESPQGEGGFGYDPIFYVPSLKCSAAQLSKEQKNEISHRAKALNELKRKLKDLYGLKENL